MNSKYLSKDFITTLSILMVIFFLDRITKEYVIFLNNQNYDPDLFLSSFLNIVLIWNDGIAFGLLSFDDKTFYNSITILISIIITILLFLISKTKNMKKYYYIFITGGALGNLFDRIFYNAVPDFIDLHYNGFHWFIFNIADIFITLGIFCLIYDEVFLEKRIKEND
jgi:signal peptidase II